MVAFIPAVTGGWIYDDHSLIQNNVYVHSFAEWPRWFVTDFWDVSAEITRFASRILYWRPAISATYALDWKLGGGSPLMFHITNTVMQAFASGLVFVTLLRWVGSALPALAASLVFVVHPTKVESVAWIAGRTDIVCLAAILLATMGIARRLSGRPGGLALEVAGTIVAYLSKEQAIVLPCFAVVELWVAAGRPPFDRRTVIKMLRGALPQLAVALGYLLVRKLLLPIGAAAGPVRIGLGEHGRAVLETFGRFIGLAIAPHDLSIQQGLVHTIHHDMVFSTAYVVLGIVSTLGLCIAAWLCRRRFPIVTLGIALYFATVAPTSNLAFTGMVTLISERFLYLPLLGLVLAFAGVLALAERRFGRLVYAFVLAIVIALTGISMSRSHDYTDEDAFWARELELHPDSPDARGQAFEFYRRSRRFHEALSLWQHEQPYDVPVRERMQLASSIVTVMSQLVPDHDVEHLQALDQFCGHLLVRQPASIEFLGVHFAFDASLLADSQTFEDSRSTLLNLRADLQSRLGHDDVALALAEEALDQCRDCSTLIGAYALELARAGRYEDSLIALDAAVQMPRDQRADELARITAARALFVQGQTLQGPAALQARASELAKLELWGRAFDVLAPYETDIAHAPKFAVGFAELAFRAGEPAVARRVLGPSKTPSEIDTLIAEWTAKMGWTR